MTEDRKPETPGMEEVSAKFVDEAETATAAQDALLEKLAVDYYAAYIARDAATDAREEVEHQAEKLDSEAIRIEGVPTSGGPDRLFLPFLFDSAGTPTPSREQVSQYCDTDKLTEAVIRHLEEYGERCVAALEAAGWPEKQVEYERAEQRVDRLFDQMVQTPAQGLRGIAAKMKGLVYPHEWEFLRDGKLDDFDDQINTEMLVSLIADVECLAEKGAAAVPASVTEPGDAVVVLRQRWENVMVERGQLKNRDDENLKHPDVLEDERLHDVQLDIEDSVADTPTHTAAGIVAKLLQLQRNETEFDGDAPWRPAAFRTALEALSRSTMSAIEDPLIDEPLLALDRRWREAIKAFQEATPDSPPKPSPDDMTTAINDAQEEMAVTPARTIAGVLVKLRLYADLNSRRSSHSTKGAVVSIDQRPLDDLELDQAAVVGAMRDLVRLAGEG